MTKVILVSSPKGGSGKSVVARHLLVLAAQNGLTVLGVDFDKQGTLEKWGNRRKKLREKYPDFIDVPVISSTLQAWRSGLNNAEKYDLVVVDTPPSVEDHMSAITGLAQKADLVVIPSVCTQDDVDSVLPWVSILKNATKNSIIILNRANRRTNSFARIRGSFLKVADVCPVELPQLEDVHVPSGKGLTLLDFTKSRGQEAFEELWLFVKRKVL
ncbi:ParA family protein [Acetobacter thailandicus]|uniref:ParA family protein n=1 Tax=Acetobacter thailandicus TaxID=1502842 RepID=UPI001BAA94B5|nr:ParA family protein [Acetobacter thailandicus]MBS0961344.1 ParA family protein [Acetobacter thailandicus]